MAAKLKTDPENGLYGLSDEQLHRLLDRLVVDDPDALKLARRLVAAGRSREGQTDGA